MFDSGVGGLSVWRVVRRVLPAHDLVYFADQKYCPYGPRPRYEILARARHISEFLIDRGCHTIVVACNTASAAALYELRAEHPEITFVGMEPAVKPAVRLTKTGIVGVLATEGTLDGELYSHTRREFAGGVRVVANTAPGLVESIERGDTDSEATRAIVRQAVAPIIAAGADVLALGCTHYPFVAPIIRECVGDSMTLVDPSEAVARQTERLVRQAGQSQPEGGEGQRIFFTSGEVADFERVLRKLVGVEGHAHQGN